MHILWMGSLIRVDVHNNQPNRPGYTQTRHRLWGIIYTQPNLRSAYTAQCEVGGTWDFRDHKTYNRRGAWSDYPATIRWKIKEHGFRSLIEDDNISTARGWEFMNRADPETWSQALIEYNQDAYDKLRSSWMMHLLKNAS